MHSSAQSILVVGVSILTLRALIPLGYMPGNLLAGEFVVLCPTGVPAEVMRALHGDHHDHEQPVMDVDKTCPIGSALQPVWMPLADIAQEFDVAATPREIFYQRRTYRGILTPRYRSRAPPLV